MKKTSWLALCLSIIIVFTLFASTAVLAKGKDDRGNSAGHGNQPLKQWEALGYAAHIAGWDGSDEDDIAKVLSDSELLKLARKYAEKMEDEDWYDNWDDDDRDEEDDRDDDDYTANRAASASWTLELWVNAYADRMDWDVVWDDVDEADLAKKLGITNKHPKGKYQPNRPIAKGEVKKLLEKLSRLTANDLEVDDDVDRDTYTGTVTETQSASNTFKVRVKDNQWVTWSVTVTAQTPIYLNNLIVPFSYLLVGDEVRIILNDNKLTRIIIVKQTTVKEERTGEITALSDGTNGKTITLRRVINSVQAIETYVIPANVKIYAGNVQLAFADLRVADTVKLSFENNVMTRIDVLNMITSTVQGELTTIQTSGTTKTLTIRAANGQNYVYQVNDNQEVLYSKWKLQAADLMIGDKLTLSFNRSQIMKVEITDRKTLTYQGTLQSVINPTSTQPLGKVTIHVNNMLITLHWTADTTLLTNQKRLTDLLQKEIVVVTKGNVVTSVVYSP